MYPSHNKNNFLWHHVIESNWDNIENYWFSQISGYFIINIHHGHKMYWKNHRASVLIIHILFFMTVFNVRYFRIKMCLIMQYQIYAKKSVTWYGNCVWYGLISYEEDILAASKIAKVVDLSPYISDNAVQTCPSGPFEFGNAA